MSTFPAGPFAGSATGPFTDPEYFNTLEAYVSGLGGGGGSGANPAVVVASSSASSAVKAGADYVCTGSNDQNTINTAVNAAAASGSVTGATQRGTVLLTGGPFIVSGTTGILLRTGVWLCGMGALTEIRAVSCTAPGVIRMQDPNSHVIRVSNLWINGNGTAGGSCNGVDFDATSSTGTTDAYPSTSPDSDHWIHDLLITNMNGGSRTGIRLWATGTAHSRGNMVANCQIRSCSANGIWFSSSSDNFIINCHIGTISSAGYRIEGGNTKITGCKSFYCDTYGLYLSSGRATVAGFESQDDATGVYVGGANSSMAGITADTAQNDGIVVATSNTVITGFNVFLRSGGRYTTMTRGLNVTGGTGALLVGMVDNNNVTTPISGTPSADSTITVY